MTRAHSRSAIKTKTRAGLRRVVYYLQSNGFVYQSQKFSILQAEFERLTGLKKPEKKRFRDWIYELYEDDSPFLTKPPTRKKRWGPTKKEKKISRRQEYENHLNSQKWKDFRETAFEFYGRSCMECGKTQSLHIHHKHYRTLFNERLEDVMVLCKGCHEEKHGRKFV